MKAVIKAGRLANGFERGKGSVVHVVESNSPYCEEALCGARPSIQWIEKDRPVSCKKCLKKIEKEHIPFLKRIL